MQVRRPNELTDSNLRKREGQQREYQEKKDVSENKPSFEKGEGSRLREERHKPERNQKKIDSANWRMIEKQKQTHKESW
jgi:hypothetical protein